MVRGIIFYFCRLFAIFLSFFFFVVIIYFVYYFTILQFIFIIYLFITTTYCKLTSIYYLINNYLLTCSLITLKIYLVYTIISIFYYSWPNYVSPHFFFSCRYYSFEYISEVLTFPIDTTHCDTELAFDCFAFSFSWVTLCDHL